MLEQQLITTDAVIVESPIVKITDFGIVKVMTDSVENPCDHTGKKNPNCFQPSLCNNPSTCLIFEPPSKRL